MSEQSMGGTGWTPESPRCSICEMDAPSHGVNCPRRNNEHLTCMECHVYPCKCVAPPKGRIWYGLMVDGAYYDMFAAVLAAVERQDAQLRLDTVSEFSLEQCIEDAASAILEAIHLRNQAAL